MNHAVEPSRSIGTDLLSSCDLVSGPDACQWQHALRQSLTRGAGGVERGRGSVVGAGRARAGPLEQETNRDEIAQMARQHADETRQHIANIEKAFELLGEEVDDSPSPAMQGIQKEGKATLKKIDDAIIDAGILAGMIETEHYEIAVYEILVTNAEARGATEVATLLRENLDSEQKTLDTVKDVAKRIATGEGYAAAAAA